MELRLQSQGPASWHLNRVTYLVLLPLYVSSHKHYDWVFSSIYILCYSHHTYLGTNTKAHIGSLFVEQLRRQAACM